MNLPPSLLRASLLVAFCLWAGGPVAAQTNWPVTPVLTIATNSPTPAATNLLNDRVRMELEKSYGISDGKHRLAPGDVIEVRVYQEDELNTRARVDSDGTVQLPLLGAVKVSGKPVSEARDHVRDLLLADYLHDPVVFLTVVEHARKRFSIMGEVRQPGVYVIPENEKISLLQALSMAGGYTPFANSSRITIKRTTDGKESILQIDAASMAKRWNEKVMEVEPDDAITVPLRIF